MARIEGLDPTQVPFLMRPVFKKVGTTMGCDLTRQNMSARVPRLFRFSLLWLFEKGKSSQPVTGTYLLRMAVHIASTDARLS